MTLVLIANIALAALVFAAVIGLASWAIRGSHHEGRPVTAASGRQWARPTIALRRGAVDGGRRVRPFASSSTPDDRVSAGRGPAPALARGGP